MSLERISIELRERLAHLGFGAPVSCTYNPLDYAWVPHAEYLRRFGRGPREIVFLGMNPGPWGMMQTGIPFGDVEMVRDWLGITGPVSRPAVELPSRAVTGFSCHRREISGSRFWGWARASFGTPERFFASFFVVNYCPLCFFSADGSNLTPDRLPGPMRDSLFSHCDPALRAMVGILQPRLVIGIGRFAEGRARQALDGFPLAVGGAAHPSGANPRASRDWGGQMNATLQKLGVAITRIPL
ncbi:MAG: hypothetical protein H6Q05_1225 [Acidobacteria bacterium]|jgi:single-strand selective monofunctional uracil DNA glycosylase|nr:hypothetical protein [Acidobacteriota bacterium]